MGSGPSKLIVYRSSSNDEFYYTGKAWKRGSTGDEVNMVIIDVVEILKSLGFKMMTCNTRLLKMIKEYKDDNKYIQATIVLDFLLKTKLFINIKKNLFTVYKKTIDIKDFLVVKQYEFESGKLTLRDIIDSYEEKINLSFKTWNSKNKELLYIQTLSYSSRLFYDVTFDSDTFITHMKLVTDNISYISN